MKKIFFVDLILKIGPLVLNTQQLLSVESERLTLELVVLLDAISTRVLLIGCLDDRHGLVLLIGVEVAAALFFLVICAVKLILVGLDTYGTALYKVAFTLKNPLNRLHFFKFYVPEP